MSVLRSTSADLVGVDVGDEQPRGDGADVDGGEAVGDAHRIPSIRTKDAQRRSPHVSPDRSSKRSTDGIVDTDERERDVSVKALDGDRARLARNTGRTARVRALGLFGPAGPKLRVGRGEGVGEHAVDGDASIPLGELPGRLSRGRSIGEMRARQPVQRGERRAVVEPGRGRDDASGTRSRTWPRLAMVCEALCPPGGRPERPCRPCALRLSFRDAEDGIEERGPRTHRRIGNLVAIDLGRGLGRRLLVSIDHDPEALPLLDEPRSREPRLLYPRSFRGWRRGPPDAGCVP